MFSSLAKDGRISIKSSKKNALVDFLSVVPEIVTFAAKRSFIIKGFLVPGMIDSKFKRYPDFNTILSTCRRNPSREEYQLCYNSFIPLLKRFQENGHIDDE